MSRNKIGILILIFVLLGAYVYFYEIVPSREVEQAPEVEKVIDFKLEDVQEIVLKKRGKSILLKIVDGQWSVTNPGEADVSNKEVHDLLSFFNYGIVRLIDANPLDLKQYGLESPRYEFGIKAKGDDIFQTLLIGDDAPGSLSCYAKVKGQSRVVLLGVRYRQELKRALKVFSRALDSQE